MRLDGLAFGFVTSLDCTSFLRKTLDFMHILTTPTPQEITVQLDTNLQYKKPHTKKKLGIGELSFEAGALVLLQGLAGTLELPRVANVLPKQRHGKLRILRDPRVSSEVQIKNELGPGTACGTCFHNGTLTGPCEYARSQHLAT